MPRVIGKHVVLGLIPIFESILYGFENGVCKYSALDLMLPIARVPTLMLFFWWGEDFRNMAFSAIGIPACRLKLTCSTTRCFVLIHLRSDIGSINPTNSIVPIIVADRFDVILTVQISRGEWLCH